MRIGQMKEQRKKKAAEKREKKKADKQARMGHAKVTQVHDSRVRCPNGHLANRVFLGRATTKPNGFLSLPPPRQTHWCEPCKIVRLPGKRHGGGWEPITGGLL